MSEQAEPMSGQAPEPGSRKPPDVSGAGLLLRGPPLSPGVVRGVGTTSRDPIPRAPLSVGASAAEWEILDVKVAPGPVGILAYSVIV